MLLALTALYIQSSGPGNVGREATCRLMFKNVQGIGPELDPLPFSKPCCCSLARKSGIFRALPFGKLSPSDSRAQFQGAKRGLTTHFMSFDL